MTINSKFTAFAIVVLALSLGACAAPSRVDNMTPVQPALAAKTIHQSVYKDNIRIAKVAGGAETNPMWTSQVSGTAFHQALEISLERNGLVTATPNADPQYEISAFLHELEQPVFGLNMSVTSRVRYDVIDRKKHVSTFDKEIIASYTATMSEALYGVERLRRANEGSIRENIRLFIRDLILGGEHASAQ